MNASMEKRGGWKGLVEQLDEKLASSQLNLRTPSSNHHKFQRQMNAPMNACDRMRVSQFLKSSLDHGFVVASFFYYTAQFWDA